MRIYKFFLILAVLTIIALFFYPRASAQTPLFQEAPETTPQQMVVQYAISYQVDPTLAGAIVACESRYNPQARNPDSTATGLYQFLQGSWNHWSLEKWGFIPDALNARYNAELGAWVLFQYGTGPWSASQTCWRAGLPYQV